MQWKRKRKYYWWRTINEELNLHESDDKSDNGKSNESDED